MAMGGIEPGVRSAAGSTVTSAPVMVHGARSYIVCGDPRVAVRGEPRLEYCSDPLCMCRITRGGSQPIRARGAAGVSQSQRRSASQVLR